MQNGQQIVLETYDGNLQKLNILQSDKYSIDTAPDGKSILFTMCNCERDFELSTEAAKVIDFDLVDRIVKGIFYGQSKDFHNCIIYLLSMSL